MFIKATLACHPDPIATPEKQHITPNHYTILAFAIFRTECYFCILPERTGRMQLKRIVNANKTAKSLTISITEALEVKIIARFSGKAMIIDQNRSPTIKEDNTEIVLANFAPFALPAPSSYATRTLN